jgi:hypothetical protein
MPDGNDDEGGFDLQQAVQEGAKRVVEFTDIFGVSREQFVCDACEVACEATTTYNPHTAAFDEGACPCWACPSCGKTYVRDVADDTVTMDLYERDGD